MKLLRSTVLGGVLPALIAATVSAIDLDVNRSDIEAAMKIARGVAEGRAAFHAPYRFAAAELN